MRSLALEAERLRRRHRAGQIGAVHRPPGGAPSPRLGFWGRRGEAAAALRARVADVADQGPRAAAADPRHAAVTEPVEPATLGGSDVLTVLRVAHDDAAGVDPIRLHRLG